MIQAVKDFLVSLGPESTPVRLALRLHARGHGFHLRFVGERIEILRRDRCLSLHESHFNLVPIVLKDYDRYFDWIEASVEPGRETLDFSGPAFHTYRGSGIGFHFPGIPEESLMDAYSHWHRPQTGDVVFDVGAHAGMTTYFLSRMVGPDGRVIAFEPDDSSYEYLLRNVEHHRLQNVVPVKKAMAGKTGTAIFNMDGTVAAGISEYLVYRNTGRQVTVETLSFPAACAQFGVPTFVKMDIEGAELDVIRESLPFLREHAVHFAFDSCHRLRDGTYTYSKLEELLGSIRYRVASSAEFGEMFTWAQPPETPVTTV